MESTQGHLFLAREPPGCFHDVFQSEFGVGRGCGVTHSDGGGEDTVDDGSVELGANFQGVVHLLEQSEDEHPLVNSLDDIR